MTVKTARNFFMILLLWERAVLVGDGMGVRGCGTQGSRSFSERGG